MQPSELQFARRGEEEGEEGEEGEEEDAVWLSTSPRYKTPGISTAEWGNVKQTRSFIDHIKQC